MPFIAQKSKTIQETNKEGKLIPVITPEVVITLTHMETGKEYLSEEEAKKDIDNPSTATTINHIRRDVEVKIAEMPPLDGSSNL